MAIRVKNSGNWSAPLGVSRVLYKNGAAWQNAKQVFVRDAGTWKSAWLSDQPPPPLSSLSVSMANGGVASLSWSWPSNPENDFNRVETEVSVNSGAYGANVWTAHPSTSQVRSLGAVHSVPHRFRARTVDLANQTSAWVESSTQNSIWSPPGAAVITGISWWIGSPDGFVVNWVNPSNPYSESMTVRLWARIGNSGPYAQILSEPWVSGNRSGFIPMTGGWVHDSLYNIYVSVENAAGTNNGIDSVVWSRPMVGAQKFVFADSADSWGLGSSVWRNDNLCYQGRTSATHGNHVGCLFYGTKIAEALRGYSPTSARIHMVRNSSQGNVGTLNFIGHPYGVRPAGQPAQSGNPWTGSVTFTGSNFAAWESIPWTNFAGMVDGSVRGFGLFVNSSDSSFYRVMKGPHQDWTAGSIELNF
jgi:hypothetical protein